MINKNLGGDRIGTGNNMKVEMQGYGRSTHNLTSVLRTTQSIGTIVPVFYGLGLPADSWELRLDMLMRTRPTEGPLFGSMKCEMHVFKWDIRLGIAKLHMNLYDAGIDVSQIKFPLIEMTADNVDLDKPLDNQQINPSCIFSYLGIRGLGIGLGDATPAREFTGLKYLMYWNIYKNYYANKQESIGCVIHATDSIKTVDGITAIIDGGVPLNIPMGTRPPRTDIDYGDKIVIKWTDGDPTPKLSEIVFSTDRGGGLQTADEIGEKYVYSTAGGIAQVSIEELNIRRIGGWDYVSVDGIRPPALTTFDLKNIDDVNLDILSDAKSSSAYVINSSTAAPYGLALEGNDDFWAKKTNQEGLGIKTYLADKFNAWLNTATINNISARSSVSTVGDTFTMDALIMKRKVYDYLNRVLVAGGSIDDWQEVTYDHRRYSKPEIPTYEGGLSKELIFDELVSSTASGEQPLGTLAGRGILVGGNGGNVKINCDETCYIMVLASVTPRVDYSQGNDWDNNLKTLEDLHKPEFDRIGFQDRLTDEQAWWDTDVSSGTPIYKSAGKVPAWLDYMTNYDRNLGNFADINQEGWMVLNRQYEPLIDNVAETVTIKDLTTYIDPVKYNHIWAYSSLDAQNLWCQYGVKATVRRKMSAAVMPTL